jgi:hypothetical protein
LNTFDMNEACEHFDFEDKKAWAKIEPFVVFDGDDIELVLEQNDFVEITDNEIQAFDVGVEHAYKKINAALRAAGVPLEVASSDLGNNMGYVLVRTDDTPETFVKRVMKKVRNWV